MNKNFNKFIGVARLTFKTFFGQPVGIMMAFVNPLLLTILLPYLFNGISHTSLANTLKQIIPGLLLLPTLMLSTLGVPITFSTLKETYILKKMNVVGVKSLNFIFAFTLVFIGIIIVSTLFAYAIGAILWRGDMPTPENATFIIPWLLLIAVSITIGLLIANVAKSQAVAFAMGIGAFLPIMFLAGLMFSTMNGWIKDLSNVIPHASLVRLFKVAWYKGSNYVDSYQLGNQIISPGSFDGDIANTLFSYMYPIFLMTGQQIALTRIFKWE